MYRQIIGYIPSNIIPAVVSMVMIYAYTRLLSPSAFGSYSYIFSAVLVLQGSLFYALPIAIMRFYPGAAIAGRRNGLLKEAYVIFYAVGAVIAIVCIGGGLLLELPESYRMAAWLALPMLLFRALVQLNQAVNRSANSMGRFNTIECLHAVLGFALGILGLFVLRRDASAIILGLLIAAVICSLIDVRLLFSLFRRNSGKLDRAELVALMAYSWPLVAVAATAVIQQNSDRFLLGSLSGAEVLGLFAVAYNLVERPTSLICSSITTATFPLVVRVLENEGKEAARQQAGRNGIALLAVSLPACVGLALTANYVAAVVVGPDFRAGVAALIPIMAFTALARGLRTHFIDHAFYLSGRPMMMLWTYAPTAVLNIALNLYVLPRYGMIGAAWTAFGCQMVTVVAGWYLGTSLFPVWLPIGQLMRCVAAVVPMTLGLLLIQFPVNLSGLSVSVLLGGTMYVLSAILLNVGQARSLLLDALSVRRVTKVLDQISA